MYNRMFAASAGIATVLALSLTAMAETPGSQAQPSHQQPTAQAAPQQVTLVGCVQQEADYRRAKNLGRGGAAGTGVGAGDEFIIVSASASTAASRGTPGEPSPADVPTGTSGATGAYEVTGSGEEQLKEYVGKRVEISGTIKPR